MHREADISMQAIYGLQIYGRNCSQVKVRAALTLLVLDVADVPLRLAHRSYCVGLGAYVRAATG